MLLDFTATGELPAGEHPADLQEVEDRFATNPTRTAPFVGFARAARALAAAGCRTVWLDGSFITDKNEPGDFDATFDVEHVDWIALGLAEPELLDFDAPRNTQKRVFGGELIPNVAGGVDFVEFFQTNRNGEAKGIVRIDLTELT